MSTSTAYPKRLIEVDLPIKRISAHARREKSIRHGHISTLHIWWARRPLAACRAVICAALWPDPADENCPQEFRSRAAEAVTKFARQVLSSRELAESCPETFPRWKTVAESPVALDPSNPDHQNMLRHLLLDFIAEFANWDNSTRKEYLETSRALTQAAHEALGGAPGTKPLVVDPFAGGGAIPLEALRVGADAFASDLNPVAVLLNRVVLEYIPKYGQRLADEVRKWGQWVSEQADKELRPFYPKDPDGATPIAYLWARTITCEGPGCGAEVPLIRSLWLAKSGSRSVALRMVPEPARRAVDFEIVDGISARNVGEGTVRRGSATCPCCGFTTPVSSVRRQLKQRHGGAADAQLVALVVTRPREQGRFFRLPTSQDIEAAQKAAAELVQRKEAHVGEWSLIPDEPTPRGGGSGAGRAFSQRHYGMEVFGEMFTPRQALTLSTYADKVRDAGSLMREQGSDFAIAVQTILGLAVSRYSDICNACCRWGNTKTQVRNLFTRQAISMVWDFAEAYNNVGAAGDFSVTLGTMIEVVERSKGVTNAGQAVQGSATAHMLPDDTAQLFFTDPPYYDAVPYADLSDFFYVWLKRTLPPRAIGSSPPLLTPKDEECIVDEVKGKDRTYFERTMALAMAEGRRVLSPSGLGLVVFAHKSTAGWEAQLQAMVDAGWTITGSWPIDTEMGTRLRAHDSAALASSVHLVCRPRENPDGSLRSDAVGDWRDVLQDLPRRIHEWMPRLAGEGVVGADAIFACLGPALEVFSRYSRVEKPNGEEVKLREYLEQVWAAVAKEALNMIFAGADATGFEEDARLTAMWLWTLSTGANGDGETDEEAEEDDDDEGSSKGGAGTGFVLEYDAARKIAQGLGAHLERLVSLVEIKGDKARLLPVAERTRHLFTKEEMEAPAAQRRRDAGQLSLPFAEEMKPAEQESGWGGGGSPAPGTTVLDRVHQAMLLFAAGRSEAMKRFLVEEGAGNDPRFWRLAQALSALYPGHTDEKRWVDGVLARKKGLGF